MRIYLLNYCFSSINTLKLNNDEVFTDPAMIKKASFISNDLWQDENAGSSSASDRNSYSNSHVAHNITEILHKKIMKGRKDKFLSTKVPNKMSAIE